MFLFIHMSTTWTCYIFDSIYFWNIYVANFRICYLCPLISYIYIYWYVYIDNFHEFIWSLVSYKHVDIYISCMNPLILVSHMSINLIENLFCLSTYIHSTASWICPIFHSNFTNPHMLICNLHSWVITYSKLNGILLLFSSTMFMLDP